MKIKSLIKRLKKEIKRRRNGYAKKVFCTLDNKEGEILTFFGGCKEYATYNAPDRVAFICGQKDITKRGFHFTKEQYYKHIADKQIVVIEK